MKRPPSLLRDSAPYLGLGLQLAAEVLVFYFLGSWADGKLNTAPWLMIVGVAVGVVGGLIQFFRTVSGLTKEDSTNGKGGPA
ncbi:MAG TPA: AtpZ/AtpI family protein [Bacteroidota bacterium]|nr:AtpZ/AtpI family protein [Bacteroidota bacterium]